MIIRLKSLAASSLYEYHTLAVPGMQHSLDRNHVPALQDIVKPEHMLPS